MMATNRQTSTMNYVLAGPVLWVLSVQYFIVQVVVAGSWTKPYSLAHNTISDLGNSACGSYRATLVCSPRHSLMNASFVLLGITMITGSIFIYRTVRRSPVGFIAMSLAGIGTIMVGLFPENTISSLHVVGATLPFLIGNIGLIMLGLSLKMPRVLRYYTLASGFITLTALVLFLTHTYLGIGIGGMERLVAYPQTVWLIVFGGYMIFADPQTTGSRLPA